MGLLAPYRVLDLTDENGWLCGRILGDMGADVVKVEPPAGDAGRRQGPFYHDERDPEKNLPWFAYNASKRGVTLNLDAGRGQELFSQMAARADFIVESFAPGYLDERGIGYRALRALNPRLVFTSITPFGQTGPYANYRGSDLIAMAMSGFMSLVGEPNKPPLRVTLPQAAMWTGMYAAAGTLIAHHHREATGNGQHVDVSMQAGMLWALANAPAFWSLNRENLRRNGNRVVGRNINGAAMRAIYPCKDGYINFIIYGGEAGRRSNEGLVEWMSKVGDVPDWLKRKDWAKFEVATCSQDEIDALEKEFADFIAQRTKAEFRDESVHYDIIGYPVNDARDILQDPQLMARNFWQTIEGDEWRVTSDEHSQMADGRWQMMFPGPFAKFSAGTCKVLRPAPRVGEHNEDVFVSELGLTSEELCALQQQGVV